MTIKVVTEIPKRKAKHKLVEFLQGFIDSGAQYAEVIFYDIDYKHVDSAYCNILRAAGRDFKNSIRVHRRGDKIYLERLKVV